MARFLMCPPYHYGVYYQINPWMRLANPANQALAQSQWEELVTTLRGLGAEVELIEPVPGLPDMVFTANAGLVHDGLFIRSNFRHPQRKGEEPHFEEWFRGHGYQVMLLPSSCAFEGMGDIRFYRDLVFAGFFFRSDVRSHLLVGERLGKRVVSLELVDRRFYHLDTCLVVLSDDTVMYYPGAFAPYSLRALEHHSAQRLEVGPEDALAFACNSVVIGHDVVANRLSPGLKAALAERGFRTHEVELSEFIKAGGSAACLTLRLD